MLLWCDSEEVSKDESELEGEVDRKEDIELKDESAVPESNWGHLTLTGLLVAFPESTSNSNSKQSSILVNSEGELCSSVSRSTYRSIILSK